MLEKIAYIAACLILPIVWGFTVNWLFELRAKRKDRRGEEPVFPDYQI